MPTPRTSCAAAPWRVKPPRATRPRPRCPSPRASARRSNGAGSCAAVWPRCRAGLELREILDSWGINAFGNSGVILGEIRVYGGFILFKPSWFWFILVENGMISYDILFFFLFFCGDKYISYDIWFHGGSKPTWDSCWLRGTCSFGNIRKRRF